MTAGRIGGGSALVNDEGAQRAPAELRARTRIDAQLNAAGWAEQDKKDLNLYAGTGVACREVVMAPQHGRVDYLLYVHRSVVGVIEAKPEGTTLSGVEWQSAMYATGLPPEVRLAALTADGRLPFVFEASGSETHFTNGYDPDPRSRRIFSFPRPETLARLLRDAAADPASPTWRVKVRELPELDPKPLRPAQITAIAGIERSLIEQRFDRSLVQMATGAGKTYAAVTLPTGCCDTAASGGSYSWSTATTSPIRPRANSTTTARPATADGSPRYTASTS